MDKKIAIRTSFLFRSSITEQLDYKNLDGKSVNCKTYVDTRSFYSKAAVNKTSDLLPLKIVGESKHYPPANKEWSNSVYAYNKNFLRTLPVKDNMAKKVIKSYFYLSNCKDLARSRRMRSLIRKSTVNKLFVSKPEIKQTSDKAIATIYAFDRERQFLLRKIYLNIRKLEKTRNGTSRPYTRLFNSYENWRSKFGLGKAYDNSHSPVLSSKLAITGNLSVKDRKYHLKNKLSLTILKRKRRSLFQTSRTKGRSVNKMKRHIVYSGAKMRNQAKFLRYVTQFNKKNLQARKRVFYAYMKHILHQFNIKVLSFDKINVKKKINRKNKNVLESVHSSKMLRYNGKILFFLKGSNKPEMLSIDSVQANVSYLDKVNLLTWNFLNSILNKYQIPTEKLFSLFVNFSKANFKKFLSSEYKSSNINDKKLDKKELDRLNKELSLMNHYINLKINRFKFSKYLPVLKLMLSRIYNKKVELNLVNLKYPHLNTDIFTEAIATNLKKKVGLLKVIRKSLKLVKIPHGFNEKASSYDLNKIQSLNIYKSLKLSNLKNTVNGLNSTDDLQLVLDNLYPRPLVNGPKVLSNSLKEINDIKQDRIEKKISTKVVSVLNTIRHKWVTGVRLEAAGRLTRRYTAARSVYKFRYKGSLKNTDYSRKLDFLNKSMPVVKFRNYAKANSQYTFTKSKRRIGAFGIKGWISSY